MPTFHTDFLFASLFWGSLGVGCAIYGKKQGEAPALVAGLALVAVSYLVPSALWMSAAGLLLLGGLAWAVKRGY